MFGLFILEFPPPFFFFFCVGLQIELMCFFAFPLLLLFPCPGSCQVGYRMYICELCARQRGRKTFFFLFLYSFKEKSLELQVPIWRHSKYSLSLRFCIQVWSFPCRGERDWHKENNECNFPPSPPLLFTTLLSLPLCVSLFKRESLL